MTSTLMHALSLSKMKFNSILICHPFRKNRPPNYIFLFIGLHCKYYLHYHGKLEVNIIRNDPKSISKGKLKVTGQDEGINKSSELRRARTLSFKMKLRAKYLGYELTQWQQKLAIENIYIYWNCVKLFINHQNLKMPCCYKTKFLHIITSLPFIIRL